jgi:HSP20 family protein
MSISVDTETRKFRKDLVLPINVDPDSANATYKNGVLEVALKVQKEKSKGKSVSIK